MVHPVAIHVVLFLASAGSTLPEQRGRQNSIS